MTDSVAGSGIVCSDTDASSTNPVQSPPISQVPVFNERTIASPLPPVNVYGLKAGPNNVMVGTCSPARQNKCPPFRPR